ncbi:MAG TPA: 4-hydroxy-tetrahydrodipicolinate synthase [Opitutaceae bacterium]|nr:4-hydroxy-tetrahydrodipicolinate synthase [Opitutaceae bacterium]
MSNPREFTGAITALVTPFRHGQIAYDDLDRLVDAQIAGGIKGLVPVGTTGESPTLDYDEHIEVVRRVVARSAGRVPVLAGTGSNSTREAVELTKKAEAAGADAMLVVAPYYNKPSQEGLFRHYSAIADATAKPIVLYSIPGRCGIEIAVPTIARLRAAFPHINHIKEAGGSCDRVDQIRQACGDSMTILCGDDGLTLPFMSLGAKGVISVASNLFPAEIAQLCELAAAGRRAEALTLHARFQPLFKNLFVEPNPVPAKYAMAKLGQIGSPEVRLPLYELTDASRALLDKTLADLRR